MRGQAGARGGAGCAEGGHCAVSLVARQALQDAPSARGIEDDVIDSCGMGLELTLKLALGPHDMEKLEASRKGKEEE